MVKPNTDTDFSSVKMPSTPCPWCGVRNNAASSMGNFTPRAGDAAVCAACAGVSIYLPDFSMRKPTHQELITIEADPEFMQMVLPFILMKISRGPSQG